MATRNDSDPSPSDPSTPDSEQPDSVPPDSAPVDPVGADAGRTRENDENRRAVAAFAAVGVVSSVFYLVVGRRLWFFNDEWDFLAGRSLGDVHGLFTPHNGHWVTLPIIFYRLMWWVVGLRSYLPYQVLIVALHLLAAWLVRKVMRRAGVAPWIATITAIVLVLFGTGAQDIVWPFQITYVGALVFGLTQLLLADHDGPFDRRDWLGLAAGLAGLLCSGVAVTMVVVVGIATLLRRGTRAAAFHTVPLALAYVVWYLTSDRDSYSASGASFSQRVRFVLTTPFHALRAMSGYRGGQVLLVALLVVGFVLASRRLTRAEWSARYAAPFALLIGAGVFLAIASFGRAGPTAAEFRGRYLDVELVFILPVLGVAADAVARRGSAFMAGAIVLLLTGVVSNVRAVDSSIADQRRIGELSRVTVESVPSQPLIHVVPRGFRPLAGISAGWLIDGAASGRIPRAHSVSAAEQATEVLRLSLNATRTNGNAIAPCRALTTPVVVNLRSGEAIRVAGGILQVAPLTGALDTTLADTFNSGVVLSPMKPTRTALTFRVMPYNAKRATRLCGPRPLPGVKGAPETSS
jgi:hypothetical protein